MTSKPRSKDSEQSDAILYYFVKTEENQGSFCVLGIFRLTCFISYTSLYHLYITSIYHVSPCHGLLRFDPMWRGLLWGWSTTEFAQALQLFTFSTMAAWQNTQPKKSDPQTFHTQHVFFLAAGFWVEDPGVFFGHPEFQVVFPYKIWKESEARKSGGWFERNHLQDWYFFGDPLFWMPTKRGLKGWPKVMAVP